MATIRRRTRNDGSTRWQAIVRLQGAPPTSQVFKRKTDATEWAAEVERAVKTGSYLPRREAAVRTLDDAIARYEADHLHELSEGEQRNRRIRLSWWRARLGRFALLHVTPARVGEARDALIRGEGPSGKPVSGPTSNRYVATLGAVLDLAVKEWQWVGFNAARLIRRKQEHRGRVRFLSVDEQDRLLAACRDSKEPRLHPLVLCALASGARQGELLTLRWSELQLDREPVRATLGKTKNRDRRVIFFPGEAGEELRRRSRTPHISGLVFANPQGKPTFPRKPWARALVEAEIQDFTFHDLRHSFASYAAMSGASLPELAALLGHRSLSMVARYAHLAEQHQEAVASRMAAKFLGGASA
jgi:integrase